MTADKDPTFLMWVIGLLATAWLGALSYIQYDGAVKNRLTDKKVTECHKRNDAWFVPRTEFDMARDQHNRDVVDIKDNISGIYGKLDELNTNVAKIVGQLGCKDQGGG